MSRIRSSFLVLTAAAILGLVACNGGLTFSKSVSYGPFSLDGAPVAGQYVYNENVNFRNSVGDDIDKLSSFRVLRLELTIDLTNDTEDGTDDNWTWVGGGSVTITNPDANNGNPLQLATVSDQSANTTQSLIIEVTDQELIGFAQSTNDTNVNATFTVNGGSTDGSIDLNGSIKVRFTIK